MTELTQTASGRAVDLMAPKAADIDFVADVAPGLARIARFAGAANAGAYSVAQHCALGADALLQETGRVELAAWFILHDAHEYVLGDLTSPASNALERTVNAIVRLHYAPPAIVSKDGSGPFKAALTLLKHRLDLAIHQAAGLQMPDTHATAMIRDMDIRMLKAERDQLLTPPPQPWHASVENARPVPMRGRITIWPWPVAAEEWLRRFKAWCPQASEL